MNRASAIRAFDVFSAGLSYFKNGYGGYLAYFLGFSGTVSSVYYLAVRSTPWAAALFPTFASFLIPVSLGVPFAIFLGWLEQNSSLVRGQVRINPFQRVMYDTFRMLAEKEGRTDLVDQIDFLMKGKKKK